jgi:hypothetical protein
MTFYLVSIILTVLCSTVWVMSVFDFPPKNYLSDDPSAQVHCPGQRSGARHHVVKMNHSTIEGGVKIYTSSNASQVVIEGVEGGCAFALSDAINGDVIHIHEHHTVTRDTEGRPLFPWRFCRWCMIVGTSNAQFLSCVQADRCSEDVVANRWVNRADPLEVKGSLCGFDQTMLQYLCATSLLFVALLVW